MIYQYIYPLLTRETLTQSLVNPAGGCANGGGEGGVAKGLSIYIYQIDTTRYINTHYKFTRNSLS